MIKEAKQADGQWSHPAAEEMPASPVIPEEVQMLGHLCIHQEASQGFNLRLVLRPLLTYLLLLEVV